ncbi:hypothetical protein HL650_04780 [Blautia pseudococcoides]|nr:hypothetical protein HL650_04780 [Blautia pseudococcoides]
MPLSSALFLFCGRRRDRIKALFREPDGFTQIYKRLSVCGGYPWARKESSMVFTSCKSLNQRTVHLVLENIVNISNIRIWLLEFRHCGLGVSGCYPYGCCVLCSLASRNGPQKESPPSALYPAILLLLSCVTILIFLVFFSYSRSVFLVLLSNNVIGSYIFPFTIMVP